MVAGSSAGRRHAGMDALDVGLSSGSAVTQQAEVGAEMILKERAVGDGCLSLETGSERAKKDGRPTGGCSIRRSEKADVVQRVSRELQERTGEVRY